MGSNRTTGIVLGINILWVMAMFIQGSCGSRFTEHVWRLGFTIMYYLSWLVKDMGLALFRSLLILEVVKLVRTAFRQVVAKLLAGICWGINHLPMIFHSISLLVVIYLKDVICLNVVNSLDSGLSADLATYFHFVTYPNI